MWFYCKIMAFLAFSNVYIYQMQPKLVAVSNAVSFVNPKAPLYPRLAQGKQWDEVSESTYDLVLFILWNSNINSKG